jgi:isochorismate synthase
VSSDQVVARVIELRDGATNRFVGVRLRSDFDPSTLLSRRDVSGVTASYERPDADLALVAVGEVARAELPASATPSALRPDVARLLGADVEAEAAALRPRMLGGFSFRQDHPPGGPWDGFACGALALPELLFVRDGETVGVVVAPGVDPQRIAKLIDLDAAEVAPTGPSLAVLRDVDRARWCESVATISSEVRDGLYEKAVLAASRELGGDGTIDVGATMATLRRDYPHCHLFTISQGGATFLGASPELLVAFAGGAVSALGLAGSAQRGMTEQQDDEIGQALLESAKDRIEHETVVRAIREALTDATVNLRAPNQPQLRKFRNIQHLSTEISGEALPGVDVLELVERLHPTPAVCGWPTDVARKVIAAHEAMERGWYAGPVGWIDGAGDGEFAVALRSALVRDTRAWLFAGNGIMGDSDPAAELAEVELKFSPLTEALSGTAG